MAAPGSAGCGAGRRRCGAGAGSSAESPWAEPAIRARGRGAWRRGAWETQFGQIRVGQQPGGGARGGQEAEAPGEAHALHAEQAPGATVAAADPALQAAENGDAGAVLIGHRFEQRVQRPCLAQRRNWRETVSGLPNSGGRACQGGGRAAGPGVGGHPEDGVEPRARVADGAAGAAALADGRRVRVLRGRERGVALPLRFGLGGAEEEGGEDGPLGVGEGFPVPFGGVAAVVAEAEHGGGRPCGETREHNMNERVGATASCGGPGQSGERAVVECRKLDFGH